MIRATLSHVARVCEGTLTGLDLEFHGVSVDSRSAEAGALFAALPGERVDGHDFVRAAADRGAAAALVQRPVAGCSIPLVLVGDVLKSLGWLARDWRDRVDPRVVGITGSNGKTTTKEMVRCVLERQWRVLATRGNYNNELGVPLTLFGLDVEDDVAVIEMGASRAGDIAYLASIARPLVGLVTNVGPAHLEGFGDEAGVASAKGEIYASLPPEGCAVINADEPYADSWRGMSGAGRRLSFGASALADVHPEEGPAGVIVHTPEGSFPLRLSLPGAHNIQNAMAATAVCLAVGASLHDIRDGLAAVRPVPGRLNVLSSPGGWKVIDDTYNANPASLYAALQVLADEPGESWLVLGDMAELGPASRKLHAEMGEAARAFGVRRLYATGEASRHSVEAFGAGARHFPTREALLAALLSELEETVICLVKGSRSMGMERIVEALVRTAQTREAG